MKQKERLRREEAVATAIDLEGVEGTVWREEGGSRTRFSGLLADAEKQLTSSALAGNGDALRLALFYLEPSHDEIHWMQLYATVYGVRAAYCRRHGEHPFAKECFFAGRSAFIRHQSTLDGVIVCRSFGFMMCLNHLSPRYGRLKVSSLVSKAGGGLDPIESEKRGEIFLIEPGQSGELEAHAREQLRKKYGVETITFIDPQLRTAEASVPSSGTSGGCSDDL